MKRGNRILDLLVHALCIFALTATTIYLIAKWSSIPQQIPDHFQRSDGLVLADKMTLWRPLASGWGCYLLFSVIAMYPQLWRIKMTITEQNRDRIYRIVHHMLIHMKLCLVLLLCYLTLAEATGHILTAWFTPVTLVIVFGTMLVHCVLLFRAGVSGS